MTNSVDPDQTAPIDAFFLGALRVRVSSDRLGSNLGLQ